MSGQQAPTRSPTADLVLTRQANDLERAFGPAAALNHMEAWCLVPIDPFLEPTDRLLLRLEYLPGQKAVLIQGQEFRRLIGRADALDGVLRFAQPDRVRTFLARLSTI